MADTPVPQRALRPTQSMRVPVGPAPRRGQLVVPTLSGRSNLPAITPVKVPKLKPPSVTAKKKDDGFSVGDIVSSVGSAAGFVGDVIKGLPVLGGKLAQTALGVGEFALDTVLDIPSAFGAPEFYRSRFEQDWTKAGELGLKGFDKLSFATQRQYPIFAPAVQGVGKTAGNLAEVASVGVVDLGEPGFNYWEALKRGELGKEVLNDLGNVLMVSRAVGGGSLTGTAGAKLAAAGKPKLGAAVAGLGRFADEPIGSTVRGLSSIAGMAAKAGGLAETASAFGRIAAAVPGENVTIKEAFKAGVEGRELPKVEGVGPIRQGLNEVKVVRVQRALEKFDNLQQSVNRLNDERDSLPANDPRRFDIEAQIKQLQGDQEVALGRSGLPKAAQANILRMQRDGESARTVLQTEIARIRRSGFVQQSPEQLRKVAASHREEAATLDSQGDAAAATRLTEQADFLERQAAVIEQNPGVLNAPPPSWVSPATIILLTKRLEVVIKALDEGRTFEEIADLLTSPEVTPDLELKGYRFTPEDVEAAYRFASGQMDDAGRLMIDIQSMLYSSWYKLFNDAMQRGAGGREPLPYTYYLETPDPRFLIREIGNYGPQGQKMLADLDAAVVEVLSALRPDLLDSYNIKAKNPKGAFRKLASLDYNDPGFRLAHLIVTHLFDDLLTVYPDVMRNPMIYSARMRPMIEADNALLKLARAEDIDQMLAGMTQVAVDYPQFVGAKRVQSIVNQISVLVNGPERFNKKAWRAVRQNVRGLIDSLRRQTEETKAAIAKGELDVQASKDAIEALFAAEERLAAMEATLRTISDNPELYVGLMPQLKQAQDVRLKRAEQLKRKAVLETLLDSEVARQELEQLAVDLDATEGLAKTLEARGFAAESKRMRAGLRGVAVVGQANLPSGEKAPRRATLRVASRQAAEAEMAGLRKDVQKLAEREQTLRDLRERHAQLDEAKAQSEGILAGSRAEQELARPFGPQLLQPGEQPIYLPGGPTRQAVGGFGSPTELRAEGMATATKGSYERMRETTLAPLSLTEVGQRMSEIFSSLTRNEVVEAIVKDPEFAKSTAGLLGPDRIEELRALARQQVEEQSRAGAGTTGLIRDEAAIERAAKKQFGTLLARDIERLGYEPVSPVRVNDDGTHEAFGDVLRSVDPADIDENTYLMRRGLKQQISQQFVYQESSAVPTKVRLAFDKIGRLTSGWKSMILPFSLRWQVGDAVSNVMMAWVRGDVSPKQLAKQMRNVIERLKAQEGDFINSVESSIADPLLNVLVGAGLQSRGLRLGDLAVLRSGSTATDIGAFNLKGPFKQFRSKMFRLNELHNTIARMSVALDKLGDILDGSGRSIDEITPASYLADTQLRDSVNQAVRETNEALGAFSQLSPFEKNVVRQVYPFWSWLKFINKAAAQLAIDDPERVLLMANLGSLALEGDDTGMFQFLEGKVPIQGMFFDLSFLNPYQDALIFKPNVAEATLQQLKSVSPVLTFPAKTAGAIGYYLTGKQGVPFADLTRPSYLEGALDQSLRTPGRTLGEIGYMGLQSFGGPFRNVLSMIPTERIPVIAPEGRLIGTDVAIGNVQRYPQGSMRTSGAYAQPRLGPVAGPVSAALRTLGIPAPIAEVGKIEQQAKVEKRKQAQAKLRRQKAFKESRRG